jgi:hypothetical protein
MVSSWFIVITDDYQFGASRAIRTASSAPRNLTFIFPPSAIKPLIFETDFGLIIPNDSLDFFYSILLFFASCLPI